MRTRTGARSIKGHIVKKHAALRFVSRADRGLSQTLRSSHLVAEARGMNGKMS